MMIVQDLSLSVILVTSLLLSLRGYGWFLLLLLRKSSHTNLIDELFVGLSFLVLIGGVLNLLGLISRYGNLILVGFGLLLSVFLFRSKESDFKHKTFISNKLYVFQFTVFVMLGMLTIASRVTNAAWNFADDGEAYLPFIKKMLSLGSLGIEPFSERRTFASLGGSSFLDSIIVSLLGFKYVRLSDIGLGISLTLILIWHLHNRGVLRGSPFISALPLLLPFPLVNISSLFLSVALYSYVVVNLLFFTHDKSLVFFRFVLPLSTLVTLKNSNLIVCMLFFLFFSPQIKYVALKSIQDFYQHIAKRLTNVCQFSIITLPWLLSSLKDGSSLFSISNPRNLQYANDLGSDRFAKFSSPEFLISLSAKLINSTLFGVLLVGLTMILILQIVCGRREIRDLGLLICISVLNVFIFSISTDGYGFDRYSFPLNFAILLGIIFSLSQYLPRVLLFASVFFFISLAIYPSILKVDFKYTIATLKQSLEFSYFKGDPCTQKSVVAGFQKKATPDSTILVTSSHSCALDFSRNNLLLNDFPGMLSPSPGMPLDQSILEMESYLISNEIDYVLVEMPSQESRGYLTKLASGAIDSRWLVNEASFKLRYYELIETSKSKISDSHGPAIFYLIQLGRESAP